MRGVWRVHAHAKKSQTYMQPEVLHEVVQNNTEGEEQVRITLNTRTSEELLQIMQLLDLTTPTHTLNKVITTMLNQLTATPSREEIYDQRSTAAQER